MTNPHASSPTAPTSGRIDRAAGAHVFPVRVYYEDTDAAGIVYYVNYLKFAERARTEMLRLAGRAQSEMIARDGMAFVVKNCRIEYFRPARLDDALEVHSRMVEMRGATITLAQKVLRGGELLADAEFRLALMDRAGRPQRIPPELRGLLARQ
jgi:acyl-CoA thioester hydrolase